MSKQCFAKYEGAGNDFILIDDRVPSFPISDKLLIQRLCHRKFGIGADGLILFQSDFRMRIFNNDGSEAESCGNGLRCLARFLTDLGLPPQKTSIRIGDRIVEVDFVGEKIGVQMGSPRDLKLNLQLDNRAVHFVDTGVPHAVVFVPDVSCLNLAEEGPLLRHHPFFRPRGANANFASLLPDGSIRVRTFERGVEGETLACGTGAVAVAAIASQIHRLPSPIRTLFSGGEIEIHFANLQKFRMVGPARRVFEGTFCY